MSIQDWLLIAVPGVPLALLAACLFGSARERMLSLLVIAPLPALLAALFAVNWPLLQLGTGLYRPALALDLPGAVLLGAAALLWSAAGAYAASYQRDQPNSGRFVVCWLMALTGCLGVFVAADMATLYLMLAVMTLGATGLVFQDESSPARRAAAMYVALALFGESLVLVGMVLLVAATPGDTLLIRDCVAALPAAPDRNLILTLLIVGFGIKAGLVPLHVWMPLAHAAAPMPASAVLSGAVVKAGIIGLIRFVPVDAALVDVGELLAIAGMFTALYAVAVGITQLHPKVVLAYSSVSQMGFVVAVIGMGLATGDERAPLLAAFYAAHHVLLKGAMFLLVGVVAATHLSRLRWTLVLATVLAVGLGGLPLTGGYIAKYAVKDPLGDGWAALAAIVSAVGTTLLMLHFLRRVATISSPDRDARASHGIAVPWLLTALASIVVPWALYVLVPIGAVSPAFDLKALWESLWPVLVGAVLLVALAWRDSWLPRIPAGDVVAVIDGATGQAVRLAPSAVRADEVLRRWPVAALLLLGSALCLGVAMTIGRA
ncbi:MAG: proton-conducting transporter membrane subunit [Burkholderiaceae bacterium]